jgi:hypothetical protein
MARSLMSIHNMPYYNTGMILDKVSRSTMEVLKNFDEYLFFTSADRNKRDIVRYPHKATFKNCGKAKLESALDT